MDKQRAIKELKTMYFPMHSHDEAVNMAISALQEQAEREKGCPVCNKGIKIMYSPEDDLYPYAAEFCPHCGKRLK